MRTVHLSRFLTLSVLAVLVLMPLWYQISAFIARPAIELAGQFMALGFDWVKGVQIDGNLGVLRTRLNTVVMQPGGLKSMGELAPKLDYRMVGYSLVLLWALLIASWPHRMWLKLPIGTALLLATHSFSLCFTWLHQVFFTAEADVLHQAAPAPWLRDVVAFMFHFNLYIMTPLAPVLIWFAQNHAFASHLWRGAQTVPTGITEPQTSPPSRFSSMS